LRNEQKIPCAVERRCQTADLRTRRKRREAAKKSSFEGPPATCALSLHPPATTRVQSKSKRRNTARHARGAPTKI
jgi:hypothetical protein